MISRNVFGVMPLAAEGDWKVAALNAVINAMGEGTSSFIEAYTYDFAKDNTYSLGAHMLEVNPKIAAETPRIEVHPLGIGGKDAPARLGFEAKAGHATFSSLINIISANTTPMSITGERNNQQNAVFLKKSLSIKPPCIAQSEVNNIKGDGIKVFRCDDCLIDYLGWKKKHPFCRKKSYRDVDCRKGKTFNVYYHKKGRK